MNSISAARKPGRNDLCPCGSGKKYKQCCLLQDSPPETASAPRKLHIGGQVKSEGWEVLNASPAPYVDHVCNANNLSRFADNTFSEIYASHVAEHFDYNGELGQALKEWNRVLKPGGKIYISVPDLDLLAEWLLAKDRMSVSERFAVMRIIFGGHKDEYDFHKIGLNEEFLTEFFKQTGFVNARRVKEFALFNDTSSATFNGELISLNMVAEKPLPGDTAQ